MEHPFINSLSDKTLDELQASITSLTGKLTFAHRTGNIALMSQLQMALESYRNEYYKRMDEMFKKQNIATQINVQNDKA
jgi:hypothetical protein